MTARALLATFFLFYSTISIAAPPPRDETPTASVLCYHIVESPADPRMEISRETFRQHLRYLQMTGYNVIPLRHLYEFVVGKRASIPPNAVVITIDDGWRSAYTEAFPELQRLKMPFTLFIYPNIIGQTNHALSWNQVKQMSDAGVDIQSHSLNHPFLTQRRHADLDDKAYAAWLEKELAESKRILERHTGKKVSFIAYPYGDYDTRVARAAGAAGYEAALTCDFGKVKKGSDPLRMRRVIIDKKMDFAAFRHYLGAAPMQLAQMTPLPGQIVDTAVAPSTVISARIPNFQTLDPRTVGMALISTTGTTPFTYDPRDGSITLTIRDALTSLKGKYHRALVWATDSKGRRREATWTFRLPDPLPPTTALPVVTPIQSGDPQKPNDAPIPTGEAGGSTAKVVAKESRAGRP
ncbi:MAG TPA: polysaccharide deacetylase family protein [Thermoanaerobaculia bacterium]|jgi:peptidoglycan/xylan/chitin deacetylase (PgdA/CDA1 family)|nr:polysaccharide deacetylase family protein [Thermoanaerobaculia bacterium]